MKKLLLLTKTLLAAALLCVGQNAWGGWTTVFTQDYENSETIATGWSDPNSRLSASQQNRVGGSTHYGKINAANTNGTTCTYAGLTNTAIVGTEYGSSDQYKIEFDMAIIPANASNSSGAQTPVFTIFDSSNNSLCHWQVTTAAKTAAANSTGSFYLGSAGSETASFTANLTPFFYHITIEGESDKATTMTVKDLTTETSSKYTFSESVIYRVKFNYVTGKTQGVLCMYFLTVRIYTAAEIVTVPTIGDPVYAGANRTVTVTAGTSSKGNSVTTYYTTDGTAPSASNYAGSFTTATKDVTITSNCTLKAITISSTSEQSSIVDKAVTVGKLTLNAPTFTKTAYSEGNYTVTIANDQSSLEYVPASTTIKYRVGTTGDFAEYSTGVSVPEGSTLYAYVEATNYTNSSTAECATTARTGMYQVWTQDYTQVSKAAGDGTQQINLNSSVDFTVGTRNFYNIVSYGTPPTAVEVTTNVGLNTSSYFYFRCKGSSSGILKNSDSGSSAGYLGIRNLIPGQIIKISVNDTKLSAEAGAVLLEDLSTSKDYFFKASSTAASIYFPKGTYNYVYDVTVYNTKDIYNSLKTYATALAGVDNDNSAANSTLASVITAQNSAVESATTGADISTALTTLRSAMDTYASVANPTIGNKFDLSYMLLNPNLENVKDWEAAEVYGWNTDYADNNFAVRTNLNSGKDGVERWRSSAYTTPNTFAIYQEVTLPEGNYSFEAEALANQTSTMVMAAGDTEGDAITSSDFAAYSVAFTQASESEVKVGIKISSEGTNTCNWTGITSPKLYKEPASSVSATIGSTGWTTFASSYPLDLSSMTASTGEVAAYYASAVGGGNVTMTSTESDAVAAGTGIMLKGTASATITIPVAASAGTAISGNKLIGCTTETNLEANDNYYVLVNNGGTAEFQRLDTHGATIPAGKAYLNIGLGGSARALRIVFDDVTGVANVEAADEAKAKEGKFIENGKLVIVKNGQKFNAAGAQVK